MSRRKFPALVAAILALSLVGAPVTMADWREQASFSAERVDESQLREETPILRYDALPAPARDAVRRTVESSDGSHTVYGREDWPERFFYSDYAAPGRGTYALVYEDRVYRLTTYAGGGFPPVYWASGLPFVAYGLALGWTALGTWRGWRSPRVATALAVPGVAFHVLGPEFDFPLLSPSQFVGLGTLAAAAAAIELVRRSGGARDPGAA